MASTLVLRINSPPSLLTQKKERNEAEENTHQEEETLRWNIVGDAASRLVVVAGTLLGGVGGMGEHPDVVEGWFKFCAAVSAFSTEKTVWSKGGKMMRLIADGYEIPGRAA